MVESQSIFAHLQVWLLDGTYVLTGFCVVVLLGVGWTQIFPDYTYQHSSKQRIWRLEKCSKSYFTSHHPCTPPSNLS